MINCNRYRILFFMGIILMIMPMFAIAQEDIQDTMATCTGTMPPIAKDYQWISYRGKVDVTDTGGTRSCNFFMVNRIDSILYLNIHAYGVEIMRLVFTPEKVTYVNKLTFQYYEGGYLPMRVLTGIPIDFQMIQAAFNGWDDQLPQRQGMVFEYTNYDSVDSSASFFHEMTFKELNRVLEIHATLKNIRFNVPGPTSIRIPEKFKELKL